MGVLNALTVDVEDWFQGVELDPRCWDGCEPRPSSCWAQLPSAILTWYGA
jgi:hypothetical protein